MMSYRHGAIMLFTGLHGDAVDVAAVTVWRRHCAASEADGMFGVVHEKMKRFAPLLVIVTPALSSLLRRYIRYAVRLTSVLMAIADEALARCCHRYEH